MKVGDTFSSYEEFSEKLTEYKKLVHNEYWVRDAKTIENQRKRYPDTVQNSNECLKYYYLVVACKRGGRKFKPKHSTRNCSTSKQDCSAAIHIHMSKCKKYLAVTRLNECHNHKSSAAYFNSLSQQRLKLPVEAKKDIREHLETGANKKLISEYVHTRTGCNITLKDLSNINRRKDKKKIMKNLTKHQKFKMMDEQCKIMSQMCSEVSTPVFYERLNFIKSIINKWSEGELKLSNVGEYSNKNLTEENIECLPLSTPGAGSYENECSPSISDAESAISDHLDEPKKINLKDIKIPQRILKRGRPKELGNTIIGLKRGKRNSNTKNRLENAKKNHQEDNMESTFEKTLENTKEGFTENIFYLDKCQEKCSSESLNEDHLAVMTEEYLDEEFLEQRILKRERPKGLGNTIIGLKRGKRNSNTKNRLENAEKNHQEDNMESTFEKILENTKEGFTENNFYLDKCQEKCSSESLNEDHLAVMKEEYLDLEFLEQL